MLCIGIWLTVFGEMGEKGWCQWPEISPSSHSLTFCLEVIAHTCSCMCKNKRRWFSLLYMAIKVEGYNSQCTYVRRQGWAIVFNRNWLSMSLSPSPTHFSSNIPPVWPLTLQANTRAGPWRANQLDCCWSRWFGVAIKRFSGLPSRSTCLGS